MLDEHQKLVEPKGVHFAHTGELVPLAATLFIACPKPVNQTEGDCSGKALAKRSEVVEAKVTALLHTLGMVQEGVDGLAATVSSPERGGPLGRTFSPHAAAVQNYVPDS